MAQAEFQPITEADIGGVTAGSPGAPTIVLVHGWGGCSLVWRSSIRRLSGRFRIVSLDLPGTGASPAPSEWTADAMARQLLAAIDRLVDGPFVLAGHSMGGNMAARIALFAPDRVTHLALVAAAVYSDLVHASRHYLRPISGRALMSAARLGALVLESASATAPDDERGDFLRPWMRRCGYVWSANRSASMIAQLRAVTAGPVDLSRLPGSLPVLLMQGRRDPVVPIAHGRMMLDALERRNALTSTSRLVMYERGFHVPMDDCPDEFSRDLAEFIDLP